MGQCFNHKDKSICKVLIFDLSKKVFIFHNSFWITYKRKTKMPKFTTLLQEEITRLARKEVVKSQRILKKTTSSIRNENTELRKRVKSLEKALDGLQKLLDGEKKIKGVPSDDEVKKSRLTAKVIIRMREKHGLSRLKMGNLLDINHKSIERWEKGKGRPRCELKKKLLAFKKMTKREVKKKLRELSEEKTVIPVTTKAKKPVPAKVPTVKVIPTRRGVIKEKAL